MLEDTAQSPGVGMKSHTLMRNVWNKAEEERDRKGWPWIPLQSVPFSTYEISGRDQISDAQVFCLALKVGHPLQKRPVHSR